MFNFGQQQTDKGHGLMEYTLPLLLLVGAVLSVSNLPDINNAFKAYFQSGNHGVIQNNALVISPLGQSVHTANNLPAGASAISSLPKLPPPVAGEQGVCLKSGICFNIPVITGGGSLTDTLGGLGGNMASALSGTLDQIVAQLKAQNADPALINLVTQLALQGHSVGDRINYMQPMCGMNAPNCDPQNGMAGITETNGYQTVVNGQKVSHWGTSLDTSSFEQAQKALTDYFSVHPGQYQDIAGVINLESGQILNIATGVNITHTKPVNNNAGYVDHSANDAVLAHQDANTICANGGQQNVCIQNSSGA